MLTIIGVGLVMGVTSSVTFWAAKRFDGGSHTSDDASLDHSAEAAESAPAATTPTPVPAAPEVVPDPVAVTPVDEPAPVETKAAAADPPAEPAQAKAPAAEAEAPAEAPAAAAATAPAPPAPAEPAAAKPAAAAAAEEEPPSPPPEPDPDTCYGIVIGQDALERGVLEGEFDDTDYLFYLEPAGVLNADLVCAHAYPAECVRGGILMTKAARDVKKVFFDDSINPDSYELSFPKEFGYVKSLQHYDPETYEHAKYPFSKKY